MATILPLFLAALPQAGTPHLDGRPVALGDLDTPPNGLDVNDLVLSDLAERARNTYSFALLDATNGFDDVMKELGAAHPDLEPFAALGVVEGSMMLFDPPLNVPLRAGEKRRIIRGTGGLRLYLTHDGSVEVESSTHAVLGGTLAEQKSFLPQAGLLQTAESLSADQPAKYAALLNILPPLDLSVRQVCAFQGVDGYPWIAVSGSIVDITDIDPGDQIDAVAAQTNRLLRWDPALLLFQDVTSSHLVGQTVTESWGIASGDFNNDSYPDLVVGNYNADFRGELNQMFLGDASGVLRALPTNDAPFTDSDPTTDVVVADLDGDGFKDIVVGNAWAHRSLAAQGSRNYVLFGMAPSGTTTQGLAIPRYQPVHYLDGISEPFGPRDTVALDVADADGDGKLDIVAGNHGTIGAPFLADGFLTQECGQRLGDVVYDFNVVSGVRSFTPYDLEAASGGEHLATADIRFVDVASPARVAQPAPGAQKWDFSRVMVQQILGTPPDGPWTGIDHRDGFPEIVRVARGRTGSTLQYFLNDPNVRRATVTSILGGATSQAFVSSFDSYFDGPVGGPWVLRNSYLSGGVETPVPSMLPRYTWRFLHLFGEPRSPTTGLKLGCWAIPRTPPSSPPQPSPLVQRLEQYNGLNTLGISAYANALAFADFVPDKAWVPGVYERNVHWPSLSGQPDLLLGLGYELSGLANRLIPFCSSDDAVMRVEGGQLPGIPHYGQGNFHWTAGWTEKTNKGYGSDLLDTDNDGDLDAVTSNRVDGVLFVNQGTPLTPNGREGQFERVKDPSVWPETGVPYAHTLCFREDSASADFDEDGDLDVFMAGFVGFHDYARQHARGQRNEDSAGDSWFSSVPFAERYMNDANYLENQTVGQGPAGGFVTRSELLDMNGRVVQGIGGDRVFPGDFDADGRMDALEPMWASVAPGGAGYVDPNDPTLGMWGTPPNLDGIAQHKALAVRLWMNRAPPPTLPGAPLEFVDEAEQRLRCQPQSGPDRFGTLDGLGGEDYQTGTDHEPLQTRNWLSTAVADLNNDGFLDYLGGYSPLAGGKAGYNMFLNDGTGRLWDLPKEGEVNVSVGKSIPDYEDPNFAGPGGSGSAASFSCTALDHDLDGDVDLFFSFFNIFTKTVLLENRFAAGSVPHNAYASLPGATFAARPRTYSGPGTGWLQNEQHDFNYVPPTSGPSYGDYVTWIGNIDLDLDGDADIAQLGNGPGHRFYLNHSADSSPILALEDRSGDFGSGSACGSSTLDLASIFWSTRLTAHNSAIPVDFDQGDLNGDGLPDLFVNYDSRPANVYFNDGTRGQSVAVTADPDAVLISRVWPPAGAKRGEKLRIHGTRLVNVRSVRLLFGPGATGAPQPPTTILNTTPGAITMHPHQRYIDVLVPTNAGTGPVAIEVWRRKNPTTFVPSPVYRTQALAITP